MPDSPYLAPHMYAVADVAPGQSLRRTKPVFPVTFACALRALPGLGADWGPEDDATSPLESDGHTIPAFTPCSAFGGHQASDTNATWGAGSPGCEAARLGAVDNATDLAGADECACCVRSARVPVLS